MGISAIYGLPGKGKSSFLAFYSVYLANKYRKKLVTNFALNPLKLAQYCKLMGYHWILDNLSKEIIYYISCDDSLELMLAIKNSVVAIDEMGIYLPARGSTHSTPKALLKDFCQVRHDSQYLIYASQNDKQVDVALRNLTEEVFWCNGISVYDADLNNEKLVFKTVRRFTVEAYEQFMGDPKLRKNPIKTKILANKSWTGFLNCSDIYLFGLYDSFSRLESQSLNSQKSKLLHYSSPPQDDFLLDSSRREFPRIIGYCPVRSHKYSKISTWLFTHLPGNLLPKVLRFDNFLSKLSLFKLSSFEKKIIKYLFFYFSFLFLLGLIL